MPRKLPRFLREFPTEMLPMQYLIYLFACLSPQLGFEVFESKMMTTTMMIILFVSVSQRAGINSVQKLIQGRSGVCYLLSPMKCN